MHLPETSHLDFIKLVGYAPTQISYSSICDRLADYIAPLLNIILSRENSEASVFYAVNSI